MEKSKIIYKIERISKCIYIRILFPSENILTITFSVENGVFVILYFETDFSKTLQQNTAAYSSIQSHDFVMDILRTALKEIS